MEDLTYWTSNGRHRASRRTVLRAGLGGSLGLAALAMGCSGSNNNKSSSVATATRAASSSTSSASAGTAAAGATRAATAAAAAASSTPNSAGATAGGTPVRGGTLKFVLPFNIVSLDAAYSTNVNDMTAFRTIFNTLFNFDLQGNVLPELVDKWEIPGDGLTWTLHLHPGVKFHDGTPFNATAAKFNLDRVLDPANKSPQKGDLAQVTGTAAPDDNTLQIKLSAPYSPLGGLLAGRSGAMFSPAAVAKYGADTRTNPVGTGPFIFKEFLSDSHLTVARNPDYWKMGSDGKALPYLDGAVLSINTDPTAQVALLRSGQADMLFQVDIVNAQAMKTDPNLVVLRGRTTPTGLTMNMNRKDKPSLLSDIRLRQAVAQSLDPAAIVKVVLAGDGQVSPPQNFWYPEHWAYYTDQYTIKRDVQKAKQLLAAAGQPNGFEFSYMYIKGNSTALYDVIQANLADAGIKVNFEQLEVGIFADRNSKGQWDAGGSAGNIFSIDPGPSLRRYFWSDSGCVPGGPGVFAGSGFSNCEFDQLMLKGEASTDTNERKTIYQRMNALWAEPWHSPKLYMSPLYGAARKNVRNAAVFADGIPQFHEAWLQS